MADDLIVDPVDDLTPEQQRIVREDDKRLRRPMDIPPPQQPVKPGRT